ncbi:MAG: aminopeptidase P family protein [Lachnospiraceae bacterium]
MKPLEKLRLEMEKHNIDAYLIVSDDFHGSEYVGDYFKCRAYISGFDGSAGTLVITKEEAGLWTDGRYFIQAASQLEHTGITLFKMGEEGVPTVLAYLAKTLKEHSTLGYDGRTLSVGYGKKIKEQLVDKDITYVENIDLVDLVWENRPELSHEPIWLLEDCYAGLSREKKLENLRAEMKKLGADYHLLSSLDDIAWLYNIRGNDIAYNPVALAYTLVDVTGNRTMLYVREDALGEPEKKELIKCNIQIRSYFDIYDDIARLGTKEFCPESKLESGLKPSLLIDETTLNLSLYAGIPEGVEIINHANPTYLAKAIKNKTEMKNERLAHIKDGVAVTKLIYWLKNLPNSEEFQQGRITELDVSEKLLALRKEQDGFLDQSFAPIIATGAHGAIVHYEPTKKTNVPIENNTFLLMDTGGQYYEGTTDITRTVVIGTVTKEQKRHYTAVLRGNLNLANAYFKYGVAGANLDYLARSPLWELGLDYNHGTGHGVGYLLNVHEGPNAVRLKDVDQKIGTPFEEGMITSDEPGLYLEGQYGIRLENLMMCVTHQTTDMGRFMKFETLTMVPFDRDAILLEDMNGDDIARLNSYHQYVYDGISPYLTKEEANWLYQVTRPIERI